MWTYIWLGIFIATIIIEFCTFGLFSIWFSVGSLFGVVLSFFNVNPYIQIGVVLIVSGLCLVLLRGISVKFFANRYGADDKVNVIEGRKFKLIKGINGDEVGEIKMNGVIWSAVSEDGENIDEGEIVVVTLVKGNKLYVKKEN